MVLSMEEAKSKLSDAEDAREAGVIIDDDVIRESVALRLILLLLWPMYRLWLGCALALKSEEMGRSGN